MHLLKSNSPPASSLSKASRNKCRLGKSSPNTQPRETRRPALQEAGIDGRVIRYRLADAAIAVLLPAR